MDTAVGRGHGKLILVGEHAVVYGHPALAVAVDRGVTVTLTRRAGPTATHADIPCDARLARTLAETLPADGLEVHLQSDLPLGRGMGSSAAIAVALVRAAATLTGEPLTAHDLWTRAFEVERIFHGTPSGIDQAVASRGGLLRFQRGATLQIEPLACPDWTLVVLDSGQAGDTRQLVDAVRARRPGVDPVLERIGDLVERACAGLHDPERLGPLLTENHGLLQQLGVSTPALDMLVDVALQAGAYGAKLSGAGGGGVVLALTADPAHLLERARHVGVQAFSCRPVPAHPEVP